MPHREVDDDAQPARATPLDEPRERRLAAEARIVRERIDEVVPMAARADVDRREVNRRRAELG